MRHFIAALFFLPALAQAQELVQPIEEVETVKVAWDVGQRAYFPLPAGGALSFDTPGPVRLAVELRIRLPGGEPLGYSPSIEAQGDGHTFMTIRAQTVPATEGHIFDDVGGVPSVASEAHLDVPAGGQVLSFHAKESGPDFLVFLVKASGEDVPLTMPSAERPIEDPWVEDLSRGNHDLFASSEGAERTEASEPPGEADSTAIEAPAVEDETVEDETVEDETVMDESVEGESFTARIAELVEDLQVGPRLGLGLPTWGTGGVPSIAARAYLPLIPEYGGVAVSLGWYRLKYDDRHVIVDPFLGAQELNMSWRTHVVHLSGEAASVLPWELGPVQPVAGAGIDLYWARRVSESGSDGGLAPGVHIYGGGRYTLPLGALEATIGWNGGRRGFSNLGQDDQPVRESLASTHLEISWMMELP